MRKFLLGLAALSMTALLAGCVPAEEGEVVEDDMPAGDEVVVEPEVDVEDVDVEDVDVEDAE